MSADVCWTNQVFAWPCRICLRKLGDIAGYSIVITNGRFSWTPSKPTLDNINTAIEKSKLIGVTGPVGAGKSSLISAIAGEMQMDEGEVQTYVSVPHPHVWALDFSCMF